MEYGDDRFVVQSLGLGVVFEGLWKGEREHLLRVTVLLLPVGANDNHGREGGIEVAYRVVAVVIARRAVYILVDVAITWEYRRMRDVEIHLLHLAEGIDYEKVPIKRGVQCALVLARLAADRLATCKPGSSVEVDGAAQALVIH